MITKFSQLHPNQLAGLMQDPNKSASVRVWAAIRILDIALGPPEQPIVIRRRKSATDKKRRKNGAKQ